MATCLSEIKLNRFRKELRVLFGIITARLPKQRFDYAESFSLVA